MRAGLIAALAAACAPPPTPAPPRSPPACPDLGPGEQVGQVPSPPATELSGIAVDARGRLFVHNDSGSGPVVHILDPDGSPRGTLELQGVDAIDLEDIAIGPGPDGEPWVWVGDIGDNLASRSTVEVLRFPVPDADDGVVTPERLIYAYADGPRDAEALFVDPSSGALWIASKEPDGRTGLYLDRLPDPAVTVLERALTLPFGQPPLGQAPRVTAGDAGPGGVVLRTYLEQAFLWPRHPDEELLDALQRDPCPITLAPTFQAEAIAWTPAGLLTVPEGDTPPLHLHRFR